MWVLKIHFGNPALGAGCILASEEVKANAVKVLSTFGSYKGFQAHAEFANIPNSMLGQAVKSASKSFSKKDAEFLLQEAYIRAHLGK